MSVRKKKTTAFLIHSIVSVIIFFLSCMTLIVYPLFNTVDTKTIDNLNELADMLPNDYVNLHVDSLYYTGFNYTHNKHTKGFYYYTISNNTCFYFLLSDKTIKNTFGSMDNLQEPITNLTFTAKIINDKDLYTNLNMSFAKQINWSGYELEKMTYPNIITEINTSDKSNLFISINLIIFTITSFIMSIVYLFKYFTHAKS